MAERQTLSVMCWNVFHGRDAPPDKALFTQRSRCFRRTERDGTHVQVNRDLFDEYSGLIASADWSVCLLQEFPPRWAAAIAKRCEAWGFRVLTSRNQLGWLTGRLARWNPDLLGANEGGSNMVLVRAPWTAAERRSLLLNPWPARGLGERRWMSFVRLRSHGSEVCVTNLHATARRQYSAEGELMRAAEHAVQWAGEAPLLLAGDFNVRPRSSKLYELLQDRFGFASPTGGEAIDHILARGLDSIESPSAWPETQRELTVDPGGAERRLRLSDHAPVEASFAVPRGEMR